MATQISLEESRRQKDIIKDLRMMADKEYADSGEKKKYFITTFGCQMNARDSEKLRGILEEIGYEEASEEKEANLVVYNTCTVRENAEQRVYGRLGFLKSYKKHKKDFKIVMCGCMMQQPDILESIRTKYKHVDVIMGTHNLYKFAELLKTNIDTGEIIIDIWDSHGEIVEDLPSIRKHPFKASVNIMFGCNNFCTYCIVPYVRGRERSRTPEDIVNEIKELVADGVIEVMLLGQNVNSYGKNLDNPCSFTELLKSIEEIEGLERIRFMTSHPKDLSDELIEWFGQSKKLCNHLHLPVQAGSSNLLKKMNRHYDQEKYLELVNKIKEVRPDISLTTDLIVGFPGETEEDFEATLDIVKEVEYDNSFTFIYSKRTGTPAAEMENQIDEEVVKERFNRLLETLNEIIAKNNAKKVGQDFEVLVEDKNKNKEGMVSGRTTSNHLVHLKGGEELIGKIVKVHITGSKTFYLIGEMV
ncbi:tRNA (N6-isopentenyl adenosine(37)-C2)-methylthiotransferase MiaB [Vallitalea okinawensis]|uniref:tRNA (N6-isopentenyl adenosine(37)-C2)-methylthiotransferase MiaB n=1 Tax=Vallitalea okinawensis TaxID=2078660 RepID=UPI000CFBF0A8|nr:tRNA (N6-isopentenyl adenosine(37)-C2)-methylthiotransferase MiaB [Vallitalea okinawensis]